MPSLVWVLFTPMAVLLLRPQNAVVVMVVVMTDVGWNSRSSLLLFC